MLLRSRLNTRINGETRFSNSHPCFSTNVERVRARYKVKRGVKWERGGRGTKIFEKRQTSNAMKFQWNNKVLIKEYASFGKLEYIARNTN